MKTVESLHQPVMVKEVLSALGLVAPLKVDGKYIDATLGHAGLALAISEKVSRVLGIEYDPEALQQAKARINQQGVTNVVIHLGNFKDLEAIARKYGFDQVKGVIFDLGVNDQQLANNSRGFSFSVSDALLDMRLNPKEQQVKASDLLNLLRLDQLVELFSAVLSQGESVRLSQAVVQRRSRMALVTVGDFLEVINSISPKTLRKIHPATKAFMALRMAVNSELENLHQALRAAFLLLAPGGKLAVISFHSGEDRIVKDFFRARAKEGLGVADKKPLFPGYEEIIKHPKSRSARMRVLIKN